MENMIKYHNDMSFMNPVMNTVLKRYSIQHTIQMFGVSKIFKCFWKKSISPKLHLFDTKNTIKQ